MKRAGVIAAISAGIWMIAVTAGFGVLLKYETTPGEAGAPAEQWPRDSTLARSAGSWTLVMFAHPHCPCTRASVNELERIMARSGGRVQAFVVFLAPSSADAMWSVTDIWEQASRIPGVRAIKDVDGIEAGRFGCVTSGHTLLYDASGALSFSGGITPERGHEGDSAGSGAILDLLDGIDTSTRHTFVFGCSLRGSGKGISEGTTIWKR
jgi:hypothetical protein